MIRVPQKAVDTPAKGRAVSERELAKKLQEESDLSHFLTAYRRAAGEAFHSVQSSETPDFLARDSRGRIVGIELTQVKFRPVDMSQRRIVDGPGWADRVRMLPFETFRDPESYYATLAYEVTHWTRHPVIAHSAAACRHARQIFPSDFHH